MRFASSAPVAAERTPHERSDAAPPACRRHGPGRRGRDGRDLAAEREVAVVAGEIDEAEGAPGLLLDQELTVAEGRRSARLRPRRSGPRRGTRASVRNASRAARSWARSRRRRSSRPRGPCRGPGSGRRRCREACDRRRCRRSRCSRPGSGRSPPSCGPAARPGDARGSPSSPWPRRRSARTSRRCGWPACSSPRGVAGIDHVVRLDRRAVVEHARGEVAAIDTDLGHLPCRDAAQERSPEIKPRGRLRHGGAQRLREVCLVGHQLGAWAAVHPAPSHATSAWQAVRRGTPGRV